MVQAARRETENDRRGPERDHGELTWRREGRGKKEELTKNFMTTSGGFLCVLCGQTLLRSRGDAVCFYSWALPKSRPTLRALRRGHDVARHTDPFHRPYDRHPFEPPFIAGDHRPSATSHASSRLRQLRFNRRDEQPSKISKIARWIPRDGACHRRINNAARAFSKPSCLNNQAP